MGKSTKVSIRTRRQGVQGTLMLPHFPYSITMGKEEEKKARNITALPLSKQPKSFCA